ncbi:MAG TPA: isochorismatase family cysteine hydrolase [Rhizomicrobium sp.]|jgi:nicotinamidase-related amidase|nr:isochorismatase family cysteine hydrolase [Rhizomicrobium sp.]
MIWSLVAKNVNGFVMEALLVMDMQTPIVGMIADSTALLQNVRKAIDNARKKSVRVIFVTVTFRPGFPEISPNNKMFHAIRERAALFADPAGAAVHPDLNPKEDDVIVVKRRVSAFAGSDLEVILRSQGIQHLVLCGIATSGVVLSTLREAADKDYQITVLSDCCADMDAEVHNVLLGKIFPRQADVMPAAQWIGT